MIRALGMQPTESGHKVYCDTDLGVRFEQIFTGPDSYLRATEFWDYLNEFEGTAEEAFWEDEQERS